MSLSKLDPADAVDPVWTSLKSIQLPSTDILTYTFANLSRYDNDSPIFIDANDPSNSISAKQALQTVLQLSNGLKALGLKEGECVCLHAFNSIWYPLIWLGIIGSGARVVGSNPRYTRPELVHLLDLTRPKLIFAQVDCMGPITEAAATAQSKIESSNIFSIDVHDTPLVRGHASWRTLLLEGETDWAAPVKFDQEHIAVYGMTSGTTGLPKAAMISHRSVVAQTALLEDQFRARPYQPSQLICLPVFHAFASPLALVLPLRLNVPTFFLPKWSLPGYLQAIETHAITDTPVCPPIVGALTQLPASEHPRLKSLRHVISAGAALPATVQNKLHGVLASEAATVQQCWGTTEAGWHSLGSCQEKDLETCRNVVGRLLSNAQMKLVGEDGELVIEEGKPGEAFIKTPMLFSGYLGNPDVNKDAFDSDGFYRTGDQIYVRNGCLYYKDRIKETMKVKGWQVSPTELEGVLVQHPQIADVAVVGVSKQQYGITETLLKAYVVRGDGQYAGPLGEQEVKDFVAARLISYKHITGGVIFVKQIPRSPSGKILRRYLPQAERDLSSGNVTPTTEKQMIVEFH